MQFYQILSKWYLQTWKLFLHPRPHSLTNTDMFASSPQFVQVVLLTSSLLPADCLFVSPPIVRPSPVGRFTLRPLIKIWISVFASEQQHWTLLKACFCACGATSECDCDTKTYVFQPMTFLIYACFNNFWSLEGTKIKHIRFLSIPLTTTTVAIWYVMTI